jgi:hypothetical protein
MHRRENNDAFNRFMAIVTGALHPKQVAPDPDEAKIRELEQQVKVIQRSVYRKKKRG